jgi:amidase
MNVEGINRYDAATARKKIADGAFTATEYLDACLDRIAKREPAVGAWTYLAREAARTQASSTDRRQDSGMLHGIPIAIKDIIDTHDMPTEHGSSIYKGSIPASDAACVAMLRRAGAIILGKTATPEFAAVTPGRTANPHNLRHTPGGSSPGRRRQLPISWSPRPSARRLSDRQSGPRPIAASSAICPRTRSCRCKA